MKFRSYRGFHKFRCTTMRSTRYVHDSKVETFLEAVKETATRRIHDLPARKCLWRAQLGPDREQAPYEPKRMKPLPQRAQEGRANPKGIPYLYLATDRNTAIAEVRPWKGAFVSVGEFTANRILKLVDCTKDDRPYKKYDREPRPEIREEEVWGAICRAFAKPVNPSDCDDVAEYVPTQIIAEVLKTEGYDGIEYSSSLGKGHNIALFDLAVADLVACYLFKVKTIEVISQRRKPNYRV